MMDYNNPYMFGGLGGFQAPYQPTMQRPQMPQAQQSGPDWVMAPTLADVEHVNVAPGSKAWVMVQNEPIFALRTADQMGLVTTSYYRFEKYEPAAGKQAAPQYVTKEELETRLAAIQELLKPRTVKKEAAE